MKLTVLARRLGRMASPPTRLVTPTTPGPAALRSPPPTRLLASPLDLFVPMRLRIWWNATRDERMLHAALMRLSETSPHLLADIGEEAAADRPIPRPSEIQRPQRPSDQG